MLAKPSPLALRAIYSFSNHAGWSEVSKLLDEELAKVYELLSMAQDEVTMRQMQGRAQFIREFQALVREAPERLNKLKETTL